MKTTLLFGAVVMSILAETQEASADIQLFKPQRKGDAPEFLPTVNLAVGFDYGPNRSEDVAYGSFWLGASHYPKAGAWSPFYSVGIEMDLRTKRRENGDTSTAPVFGPQVRGGISYFPDNNGYLSIFNAYGLVSYRAPSAFESHAFRFGIGVSSPGLGLMLLANSLPLPWMFEGVCDVTQDEFRPSIRLGFSY
jgi:hypothetical protein